MNKPSFDQVDFGGPLEPPSDAAELTIRLRAMFTEIHERSRRGRCREVNDASPYLMTENVDAGFVFAPYLALEEPVRFHHNMNLPVLEGTLTEVEP